MFRDSAERANVEKAVAILKNRESKEIDREHARRIFNDYQVTLYDTQVDALRLRGFLPILSMVMS